MTRPQLISADPISTSSSKLISTDKNSRMIAKVKPKIRIIHIYEPEIIKTDAANFRELVQRLTGKPEHNDRSFTKKRTKGTQRMALYAKKSMDMEGPNQFLDLQNGARVKNEGREEEEEDVWKRSCLNEKLGGFFDGFSELDGFIMEDLSQFHMLQ